MTSEQIEQLRQQHARDASLTASHLILYEIALQLARLVESVNDLAGELRGARRLEDWELRERFGIPDPDGQLAREMRARGELPAKPRR